MEIIPKPYKVDIVFTAPRNDGIENNVPIDIDDMNGLCDFAQKIIVLL